MESTLFPESVDDWSWDTVQYLVDNEVTENRYLEYKEHLTYPEDRDPDPSKAEWRADMEKEFTAFANDSGGIILFGMKDIVEVHPFEPPQHEIQRTVVQFIKDATPVPEIEISNPLQPPSDETDRMLLAVRVHTAIRKPVATADASYYVRINDEKQPMGREQLESIFIEADRRQQAIRQLEVEIARLQAAYDELLSPLPIGGGIPPIQAIDEVAIRDAIRLNTHLFADEETEGVVVGILEELDRVAMSKQLFREGCRNMGRVPHNGYGELNRETQDALKSQGKRLLELFRRLEDVTQIQPPGRR